MSDGIVIFGTCRRSLLQSGPMSKQDNDVAAVFAHLLGCWLLAVKLLPLSCRSDKQKTAADQRRHVCRVAKGWRLYCLHCRASSLHFCLRNVTTLVLSKVTEQSCNSDLRTWEEGCCVLLNSEDVKVVFRAPQTV